MKKLTLSALCSFSSLLSGVETISFDADLEGFAASANATSVVWSARHGGSMEITANGGWAGDAATINLPETDPAFFAELQTALQNGGTLSFDVIVSQDDQTLTGDQTPDWFEVVVIGNSNNADGGGTGGWDQNIMTLGLGGAQWPLTPATQTIPVLLPIRTEGPIDNDGQFWVDLVSANWAQLRFGLNNQGNSVTEAVVYIDNVSVEAFSATPNEWPGGTSYATDFTDGIAPYWSLSGWTRVDLPSPVTQMTNNHSDQAQWGLQNVIGDSDGGGASGFYFNPDTNMSSMTDSGAAFTTPLDPIKTPTDLNTLDAGFGGMWLQSLPSSDRQGVATLSFVNLPPHSGIDLDFVLAAFDTIDVGDWFGNAGADDVVDPVGSAFNFRVTVDGVAVHENRFDNSGFYSGGAPLEVTNLGNSLHFSGQYRENWGPDDFGADPLDVNDRHSVGWAEDSAYNFNDLFNGTDRVIEHSSDTLTVTFEHAFNGGWGAGYSDEGLGLDGVAITLIGGAPPEIQITNLEYDPVANTVRLTWDSEPGKSYTIFWSSDLEDWGADLVDDVSSQGESTTFPAVGDPAEPNPAGNADVLFFRVQEN